MYNSASSRAPKTKTGTADAVVFVLLDAFRHDYVERTRFLADISRRSLFGRLEEPFGFCPRGAYFGGLTPAQQGFTNLMHYDPGNSVFRSTREFAGTPLDEQVLPLVRSVINAHAQDQLPDFSAAYVDTLAIPLEYLAYFNISEARAPWDPAVGYRSLFHILTDDGRRWLEISWPFASLPRGATNHTVIGEALLRLREDHAFAYIHLPSLDSLGHRHGPGSVVVQHAIDETDRLCEMLTGRILELYRDPIIIFAGDHGMVPVVQRVDVWGGLTKTGLRFGRDFVFFVDSTMVRCWFFTAHAKQLAMAALEDLRCGHWISAEDRSRWGLDGLPPCNGDEIFLARAGVVFCPNFFVRDAAQAPRGMHGYAPELLDNQAVFIAHRPRACWTGEVGVVSARRMFPTLLRWLGWDSSEFTDVPPVDESSAAPRPLHWTRLGCGEAENTVTSHMSACVETIRKQSERLSAIVLTGGFGRGEGTATIVDGKVHPRNDYDLIVVGEKVGGVAELGPTLAQQFGIEFVDVGRTDRLQPPDVVTQAAFDLRYGSRVLWGDALALERLPRYAPEQIGPDEGVYLLGNRFGGLALAVNAPSEHAYAARTFVVHQLAKFLIAIADAWLIEHHDYHCRYEVRRRRFADLAPVAGFSSQVAASIDRAFAYKLDGTPLSWGVRDGIAIAMECFDELGRVLSWADHRTHYRTRLEKVVIKRGKPAPGWFGRADALGFKMAGESKRDGAAARATVYSACVADVYAQAEGRPMQEHQWRQILGAHWELTPTFAGGWSVARAWLAQFH